MTDNRTPDDGQTARIEEVAVSAARAAGTLLREHWGGPLAVDHREQHDVKLEVDRLCEQAIVETIHRAFPDHSILAEEGGASARPGAYRWIIDPLDGTVNFFHALPYFCTSVACYRPGADDPDQAADLAGLGEPVVGVIYAPPTDELFVGAPGRGATRNGKPLAVDPAPLADAVICMGFGKGDEIGNRQLDIARAMADKVRKIRCFGAAAYDLANVAAGRLTGFYEKGLRTWDIAAGYAIVTAAGGQMEARQFAPTRWSVLAGGPGVMDDLRRQTGF